MARRPSRRANNHLDDSSSSMVSAFGASFSCGEFGANDMDLTEEDYEVMAAEAEAISKHRINKAKAKSTKIDSLLEAEEDDGGDHQKEKEGLDRWPKHTAGRIISNVTFDGPVEDVLSTLIVKSAAVANAAESDTTTKSITNLSDGDNTPNHTHTSPSRINKQNSNLSTTLEKRFHDSQTTSATSVSTTLCSTEHSYQQNHFKRITSTGSTTSGAATRTTPFDLRDMLDSIWTSNSSCNLASKNNTTGRGTPPSGSESESSDPGCIGQTRGSEITRRTYNKQASRHQSDSPHSPSKTTSVAEMIAYLPLENEKSPSYEGIHRHGTAAKRESEGDCQSVSSRSTAPEYKIDPQIALLASSFVNSFSKGQDGAQPGSDTRNASFTKHEHIMSSETDRTNDHAVSTDGGVSSFSQFEPVFSHPGIRKYERSNTHPNPRSVSAGKLRAEKNVRFGSRSTPQDTSLRYTQINSTNRSTSNQREMSRSRSSSQQRSYPRRRSTSNTSKDGRIKKYYIGDSLQSDSDFVYESTEEQALQNISQLEVFDYAFVRRSDNSCKCIS